MVVRLCISMNSAYCSICLLNFVLNRTKDLLPVVESLHRVKDGVSSSCRDCNSVCCKAKVGAMNFLYCNPILGVGKLQGRVKGSKRNFEEFSQINVAGQLIH